MLHNISVLTWSLFKEMEIIMKKNIYICTICAALLLTGCKIPGFTSGNSSTPGQSGESSAVLENSADTQQKTDDAQQKTDDAQLKLNTEITAFIDDFMKKVYALDIDGIQNDFSADCQKDLFGSFTLPNDIDFSLFSKYLEPIFEDISYEITDIKDNGNDTFTVTIKASYTDYSSFFDSCLTDALSLYLSGELSASSSMEDIAGYFFNKLKNEKTTKQYPAKETTFDIQLVKENGSYKINDYGEEIKEVFSLKTFETISKLYKYFEALK